MRDAVQPYRSLFPAVLADVVIGDAGFPLYAWVELTPTAAGAYEIQPGARSGTTELNWARELEDHLVEVGSLVWMRLRDQDSQLHFEFQRPAGLAPPPPSSGPSGPSGPPTQCPECCPPGECLPEALCLEVQSLAHASDALQGAYAVTYSAPLGEWVATARAASGLVAVRMGCARTGAPSGPAEDMVLSVALPGGAFDFVIGCTLPWDSGPLSLAGGGSVRLLLREGRCDDCDQAIDGTLCFGDQVVLRFGNTVPVDVVTAVCPVFTEIDLGAVADGALRAAALAASSFADFQARVAALH